MTRRHPLAVATVRVTTWLPVLAFTLFGMFRAIGEYAPTLFHMSL